MNQCHDVAITGGGAAGGAIARELSRCQLRVAALLRQDLQSGPGRCVRTGR